MKIAARPLRTDASAPRPVPVALTTTDSKPAAGPQTIDADLLKLIAGGLPRGGWYAATEAQVDTAPSGDW